MPQHSQCSLGKKSSNGPSYEYASFVTRIMLFIVINFSLFLFVRGEIEFSRLGREERDSGNAKRREACIRKSFPNSKIKRWGSVIRGLLVRS